jgi:pimeloyl-ACP methyl ester carboxylesterase
MGEEMHIDDDLSRFEAHGAIPLPATNEQNYIHNSSARIWYASYGSGKPVILLHGGLGHSGNWGYQVPALLGRGYRVVVIDSREHAEYLAENLPSAEFVLLPGVSHFAPLQRPEQFNHAILTFLDKVLGGG